MSKENRDTETARRTYNRIAPIYDFMEGLVERSRYSRWRELLWSRAEGPRILEVGVGTGKNLPYYPENSEITAIDFSSGMLERARKKAAQMGLRVAMEQMDVQDLSFEDNSFDTVVGSFIFCSVPDPLKGLGEIGRVCRPGGKVVLLEHVLSASPVLAWLMDLVNPIVRRAMGPNINRKTVENVARSGLVVENVTDLAFGIFKLIEARKKKPGGL